MKPTFYFIGLILTAGCTYHDIHQELRSEGLPGVWTIEQVYANDRWGGPLYWKEATWGKQVKFTNDNKYYERNDRDFVLVGTYRILSDEYVEVTWDKPLSPQYPTYHLKYELDPDGHLTLWTGATESIVLEKYRLTQRL